MHFPPEEVDEKIAAGTPFAVRLKIEDHPLRFHDLVRGEVEFPHESVSDPIIVRSALTDEGGESEGIPVYNYVVTIDDALMEITHVIRGDDHISNTPKQVAIYEAFGWPQPAVRPPLDDPRRRPRAPFQTPWRDFVSTFREMGYLPEALVNYLALLGWGAEDGKTETFTLEELTRAFTLERVTALAGDVRFQQAELAQPALFEAGISRTASCAFVGLFCRPIAPPGLCFRTNKKMV